MATQLLPSNPHLTQLKHQAKDLRAACARGDRESLQEAAMVLPGLTRPLTLSQAQHVIARRYAFSSWPRLKHFVDTYDTREVSPAATRLREAIDASRLAEISALLDAQPDLLDEHVARARNNYSNQRPLVYACRTRRAEVVQLLLSRGADPSSEGYLALARCALHDDQVPILTMLLDHGIDADIDAYDWGPLILTPCETLAPAILRLLLERGADPNRTSQRGRCQETPLQMVLGTYARSAKQVAECLEILIAAGAHYEDGPLLDIRRGRIAALGHRLDARPGLLTEPIGAITYGATGMRALTPSGGTLLHYAIEFGALEVARYLIARGAAVDARATVDAQGRGGQTPLFHAVSQFHDWGLACTELLLTSGADPTLRCTLRGHIDQPDDYPTCSVLGYAQRFPPGRTDNDPTLRLLRQHGARD